MHTEPQQEAAPNSGAMVDDVLYTVFRHKWLIVSFVVLGFLAAGVVRMLKPPLYQSEAKVQVKYVMQTTAAVPAGPETQVSALGFGGQEIMAAEVELIRSWDTALIVATNVGPERILAKKGGGNHPMAAASVVLGGLNVPTPLSATIQLTFKHPDESVAQPVLDAIIKAYMRRHLEMRTGRGQEEYFRQELEESGKKLVEIDTELKKLKSEARVTDMAESKKSNQRNITKLEDELSEAQLKLTLREALYGEWLTDSTNATAQLVPPEVVDEYREAAKRVEDLRKRVRKRLEDVTDYHPDVVRLKQQITDLTDQMKRLEEEYRSIASLGAAMGTVGGTNETALNTSSALADIRLLKRTADSISNQLAMVKSEAFRLMDFESQITELERRRTTEQKRFDSIQANLEQALQSDSSTPGRVLGMYLTQSPTPAGPDMKKLLKLVGAAFAGCVGIGFGLAFLIDMVLDRTLRRRQDVVKHLHLPVFLTIPDTNWRRRIYFPWLQLNGHGKYLPDDEILDEGSTPPSDMAVAEWNPTNHLGLHVEGLRERLITYFEVNDLNHKPRLVGVTSCDHGAGVSTLASGLAASLSKTGDGSALLVDMNTSDGRTHSFYRGKPGCGPTEVEIPLDDDAGGRKEVFVQGLPLAKVSPEQRKQDRLAKLLPPSFNHLVPKLKATEYDYIVFDMPRVSPRSVTPRLSGQMDVVLMVIESERTVQQRASRAMALMREARATVVAVLNKCRNYVPARLAND